MAFIQICGITATKDSMQREHSSRKEASLVISIRKATTEKFNADRTTICRLQALYIPRILNSYREWDSPCQADLENLVQDLSKMLFD